MRPVDLGLLVPPRWDFPGIGAPREEHAPAASANFRRSKATAGWPSEFGLPGVMRTAQRNNTVFIRLVKWDKNCAMRRSCTAPLRTAT